MFASLLRHWLRGLHARPESGGQVLGSWRIAVKRAIALVLAMVAGCTGSREEADAGADAAIIATLGGPCAEDTDCPEGLTCLTRFNGLPECPEAAYPYELPNGYCSTTARAVPGEVQPVCAVGTYVGVASCIHPTTVAALFYCAGACDSDADCRTPEYYCDSACVPDWRGGPCLADTDCTREGYFCSPSSRFCVR